MEASLAASSALENFPARGSHSGPGPEQWYAVYTCSRSEKSVARQLEERRVASFLPLYRSWRRWADRRKQIELALFPSYVFVHIPWEERLRVLQVPGVVRLVSFDGKPAPLPEQEIEALRNGLEQGVLAEPHSYLRAGRKVRLARGPLAGTEGVLLRKKDKMRFVISLEVLMRSVAVEVDAADVQAAH
ncbi:MAG: UpxY family transcription antiterminator [Acidobacteria bacterium]|nr:UpxY family transcription antiterminator [Acidobacteriota bacterium]